MKMEEGMNPAFDKQLLALGSTRAGLEHIQNMLDRGDFPVPAEREYVVRWLARERKKRHKAYLQTAEGSAIRQANSAAWAVWISCAALAVSLLALWRTWDR